MENNNKMALIVKIILIFFFILGLGMAGFFYFYYQNNILKVAKTGIQIEKDEDFDKITTEEEKNKNQNDNNEDSAIIKNNCFVDGVLVKDKDSIELFSRSIVNPYEDCNNFKKKRVCDNGFLLGDDIYKYAKCQKKLDCELPDGTIIKNGESFKLYSRSRVAYNKRGENCEKYAQRRTCKETILSGNEQFIYKQCRVSYDNSCKLLNGKIIADNESFIAYKKDKVAWNEKCNSKENMKRFICSKTEITGGDLSEYPYLSCESVAAKDCHLILNTPEGNKEKVIFKHNEKNIPLFSRGYRTNQHACSWYMWDQFKCTNGVMNGGDYSLDEYNYVRCYEN